MTELALVRHGETDWNVARRIQGRTDVPLNDRGREQAALVARQLADEHWHGIVSSPLSRALETARIISEALGLGEPGIDRDLAERAYGQAEGMDARELAERHPDMAGVPGLERRSAVTRRVLPTLERIALAHPNERMLVITHGGVIGSLVRYVTEKSLPASGIRIPNGSIHRFRYDDGVLELDEFNGETVDPPIRRAAPIRYEPIVSN
jgi:uncharacterized phosphatase